MSGSETQNSRSGADHFTQLAEVAVGATILGLRRCNTARRELVERVPALEPAVDAVLDCIDDLAEPVSDALGASVVAVGDALGGDSGDRIAELGRSLSLFGPQLVKLSGLTRRG